MLAWATAFCTCIEIAVEVIVDEAVWMRGYVYSRPLPADSKLRVFCVSSDRVTQSAIKLMLDNV